MLRTDFDSIQIDGDSRRLKTLYTVGAMFNQVAAGLEMNRILPQVLRVCVDTLEADSGSIFVLDTDFELEYAWMIDGDREFKDVEKGYLQEVIKKGLSGKIIATGEAMLILDTKQDERWLSAGGNRDEPSSSVIAVPLKVHGRINGTITIAKKGTEQFATNDLDMLSTIADQAASAISNAQLYKESVDQARELASLVSATALISSSLDVDRVIKLVAEQITSLINIEACAILEWNAQQEELIGRTLYVKAAGGNHLPKQDRLRLNSSPFVQNILQNPHTAQINIDSSNLENDEKYLLQRLGLSSLLIVPLQAQNQAIGLAMLMDRQVARVFKNHEISMVQTLANQATVAIQNARLYQETQRQLRITTLLNEASKVINSSLDLEEIMQSLLAQMNDFLHAEALSIALVDTQTNELVYTVAEGIGSSKIIGLRLPAKQGVSGWVMQNGAPAMVNDTLKDPRFYKRGDERTGHATKAIIVAPLKAQGNVLGTIQAINPIEKTQFTEGDLQLLVNLANLASSAMGNAQQYIRTQQAEARYIGLFQDNIDPIVLTNQDGKIVEVNGGAEEVLGQKREDLLKATIQALHPEVASDLQKEILVQIGSNQSKIFTTKLQTTQSRLTFIEVYAKRLFVADSEKRNNSQILQWIYHDVTEQVELQQMREDLTAMLFHDLQSPLGNIITSLELVSADLPPDSRPSLVSMVDVASKSSLRLQRLIKSLLDINRLEAGHSIQNQQFTNVLNLIDDAEDTINASLQRRNIRLARNIPFFLPDIYIDADMIRRVLINLLDNALKYSLDGDRITISAIEDLDTDSVVFSISDQGPGISKEFREVIFDKFRRITDDTGRKGIGLGLAFCRLAVQGHSGQIWVEDSEEGGSNFRFSLPVMQTQHIKEHNPQPIQEHA